MFNDIASKLRFERNVLILCITHIYVINDVQRHVQDLQDVNYIVL